MRGVGTDTHPASLSQRRGFQPGPSWCDGHIRFASSELIDLALPDHRASVAAS